MQARLQRYVAAVQQNAEYSKRAVCFTSVYGAYGEQELTQLLLNGLTPKCTFLDSVKSEAL